MTPDVEEIERRLATSLFPHQLDYLADLGEGPTRTCLYFKTGSGKSITALAGVAMQGHQQCLVVAPPSTHQQWITLGNQLGVLVGPMSHAKFRMRDTKMSRTWPVIADEFHLFGGHKGQGWRKLDKLAQHLDAPLVLLSATPNYNDAERVYCVQHILDPASVKGGYLEFLYKNCETEQNRFGLEPIVKGFRNHENAQDYLASLQGVHYVPDDQVYEIVDVPYVVDLPDELEEYRYNRRTHRLMASQIELAHVTRQQGLVGPDGLLLPHVEWQVMQYLKGPGGVLVYANHSTVARALSDTLMRSGVRHTLVTGATPKADKDRAIRSLIDGQARILVGTASLATGTDGLDRVCDTLLILDDTDDDALRRQLVGRILPRGGYTPDVEKKIFRMVPA